MTYRHKTPKTIEVALEAGDRDIIAMVMEAIEEDQRLNGETHPSSEEAAVRACIRLTLLAMCGQELPDWAKQLEADNA